MLYRAWMVTSSTNIQIKATVRSLSLITDNFHDLGREANSRNAVCRPAKHT